MFFIFLFWLTNPMTCRTPLPPTALNSVFSYSGSYPTKSQATRIELRSLTCLFKNKLRPSQETRALRGVEEQIGIRLQNNRQSASAARRTLRDKWIPFYFFTFPTSGGDLLIKPQRLFFDGTMELCGTEESRVPAAEPAQATVAYGGSRRCLKKYFFMGFVDKWQEIENPQT